MRGYLGFCADDYPLSILFAIGHAKKQIADNS